jgi:hypothetical protein
MREGRRRLSVDTSRLQAPCATRCACMKSAVPEQPYVASEEGGIALRFECA